MLSATSTLKEFRRDPLVKSSLRRRKQLASFMGSLLEEMTKAENTKTRESRSSSPSIVLGTKQEASFAGGDTLQVAIDSAGNISPHHDEMSNETPPSYNQLNYNDNLSRFFNSQPKTLTEKEVIEGAGDNGGSDLNNDEKASGESGPLVGESW